VTDQAARLAAALAGRYRIERELGRGGMATVYLAEDVKHRRHVAIKVLQPELTAALGPERFLREIEISARLDHPHILPLYDSGAADGFLYYVMPFVEGESLRDRLNRERQLPLDDALAIAREVADALSYAHSHDVVHRDVKPENILLAGGHARVADFGIARAISAAGGDRLTATGLAIGTPAYMSPEQAMGSAELDGRSDLYSLGCVLYEMLGGEPPFTGSTVESVVRQHVSADPRPITTIRPAVPSQVASALMRALAKVPADRFSPAAQFAEALRVPPSAGGGEPGVQAPGLATRRAARMRALLLGGVALAVAAGGFLAARALGIGPGAAAVGSGVAAQRERLLLADFENRTPDPTHGATVTELMRIGLAQSRVVTILDPSQVARLLELMQRDPSQGFPATVAMEAAERGGVNAVITGEVRAVGSRLALSARLVSPGGEVLAAQQETAAGPDELVAAVDRLSRSLRQQFGESLRSIRRNKPLDQVTTGSMRALRLYSQGMQASNQGDDVRAVDLLEEAVAEDSTFAMGYRKLAIILSNRAELRSRAVEAAARAYEHRDRLTERERLAVTAAYYTVVSGNRDRTISAYRTLLDAYPDDYLALNNLGVIYSQLRDHARAAEYYRRALAVDSTVRLHYSNLASALSQQKQFDSAAVILDRFESRFPENPEVIIARVIHAAQRKDFEAARRLGDSLMAAQRGTVFWEAIAYEWLATLAAMRGQLELARRQWSRAFTLTAERNLPGPFLTRAARRAIAETLLTGDREAGRRALDEALARYPLGSLEPLDRPYGHLAMAYATVARPETARRLLAEYDAAADADHGREAQAWAHGARGVIALAEERYGDATHALRRFDEQSDCATCALAWLAQAYDRAAQGDSARILLERLVETPSAAVWYDAGHLARGYRRLGELYEQRGEPDRAAEYYGRLVELWAQADPALQPQVGEVRAALTRIAAEPRGGSRR
jgi:serine/threonine-protein kinase